MLRQQYFMADIPQSDLLNIKEEYWLNFEMTDRLI